MASSAGTDDQLILTDDDLPEVFRKADTGAISNQRWHFFFVRWELIFVSAAAVTQVLGNQFAPGIVNALQLNIGSMSILGKTFTGKELTIAAASHAIPALFMLIAIALVVLRFALRRDHQWRGRRALAEATKVLAWRYSIHAMDADLRATTPLNDDAAQQAFDVELGQLEQQGHDLRLSPPKPGDVEITEKMKNLRKAPPSVQESVYLKGRLQNQQDWYARKADTFESRTTWLQWARIGAYIIGFLLVIFGGFSTNGLGAMTTIAGGFATWLVGRHYDDLAQSYGAMARRLIGLKTQAPNLSTTQSSGAANPQAALAMFVDNVETLLDGEHQDWLREIRR